MKGVSIPINTLVMLAVAIIVLLAAVAWFMGAFAPAATESSLKQKFDSSCLRWTPTNCAEDGSTDEVPDTICWAYRNMTLASACSHPTVADACGCTRPYGIDRP